MRKTIAARMHDSLQSMAQLTMNMDVVMDDAVRLRTQLLEEWKSEGLRITYTDLVIRAVAKALEKHPLMNSIFGEREITLKGAINVGMAVAVEDGLLVPVVQDANLRSVGNLVAETHADDVTRGREHLLHAGAATRPLVADDDDIAGPDLAGEDAGAQAFEHRVLTGVVGVRVVWRSRVGLDVHSSPILAYAKIALQLSGSVYDTGSRSWSLP